MRIAIIGNGDFFSCGQLVREYDYVIAADGGVEHCERLEVMPSLVIGDGDSTTQERQRQYTMAINRDQNTTDLQKALASITALDPPDDYTLDFFCVTSHERFDHALTALWLLFVDPHVHTIYTPFQAIRLIRKECQLNEPTGTPLSLVPVGEKAVVDIEGCEWNGVDIVFDQNRSGVSNRTVAETARITVKAGVVWCLTSLQWK